MSKQFTKVLALGLAAMMVLSGCGGTSTETKTPEESTAEKAEQEQTGVESTRELKEVVIPKIATSELTTFNFLHTQNGDDGVVLYNLWDGLLSSNSWGQIIAGIADEWGTEDGGLTWKFHLRDGVKWVDVNANEKADCVADDFATGLEWVLNFHKNEAVNTSMPMEMIKGAREYYEYTKTLSEEEGYALTAGEGSKFREMVGIEVLDEHNLIYHCIAEKPYFDTLAASNCLYPLAQGLVDELGVDGVNAMNNENMWYNGAYTMTTYVQGNEKVFTKNPKYWDTESVRFDKATHRMVESWDTAYHLYQAGEVDYVKLTESMVKTISENPDHEFYKYMVPDKPSKMSVQFHWNYVKNKEDGTPDTNWNTAIANEAFRKSIYYGLNMIDYLGRFNAVEPLQCENSSYTCRNLARTSDGTDYVDLVEERLQLPKSNGETPRRYDPEKAAEYKKQAMEELSALGVTFPVEFDHYIVGSNQTQLDNALVLQNSFDKYLGSDYVKLNINTYIANFNKEIRERRLQSFRLDGWGADYNDPKNYLAQTMLGNENAMYAESYSNINKLEENETNKELLEQLRTYTEMVEKADAITKDMDARYEAFADAEAYTIEKVHMLPCNYNVGWCLTRYNVHAEFSGSRMKNWETKADGYTVDEVKAILAAQGK
ncbi:MAG: ABC transporter substrate-binding protein [Negativibacillus sp.]